MASELSETQWWKTPNLKEDEWSTTIAWQSLSGPTGATETQLSSIQVSKNTGKYKKIHLWFALEIFVGENGRRSHGDVAAAGRLVAGRFAAGQPLNPRAAGRPPLPAAVAWRFIPVATPPIPGARSGAPPTRRPRPSSASCHVCFAVKCPSKIAGSWFLI